MAGVRLDVKNKWGKTAEDILRGKLQYASVEPRLSVEQQTNIEALLSMIVQEPQRRTAQIVKMIS